MRVYLDTDMVSAIAREDFPPEEMEPLKHILELSNAGKIELRTSELTRREIKPYKGQDKRTLEIVSLIVNKVPFVEDHKVLGLNLQWDRWGGVSYPLVEDDPISSALRQMGLDRTDAHHLMLAIRATCEVFLTCDRGILNRHAEIKTRFPIKPMRPSELVLQTPSSTSTSANP